MTLWKRLSRRIGALMPVVVFLLGLTLSLVLAAWTYRDINTEARAEFTRLSDRTADEIATRFRRPFYGLNGALGLYAAAQTVERDEFRAYVAARDLPREFPGVRGLGFIQRVLREDIDTFLWYERIDNAPDFAIKQLDDKSHADLLVIKYIEPLAQNFDALGLDIGSEAVRRAGAQQAIDTGAPTITGSITLVQDHKKTSGILLFVPVYGHDRKPANAEERRTALVGLLYAPIAINDLMQGMPDVASGRLDFELYDSPLDATEGQLLFDADNHVAAQRSFGHNPDAGRNFSRKRALLLPGRELTLSMNSTPQFDESIEYRTTWIILFGGTFISALLALMLRQQTSGRQRAEARARAMTKDLAELAAVVRHTSNAVVITDAKRSITWVNAGFERVSGYTAQEVMGRSPGDLLQCPDTDPDTIERMRAALGREEPFKGTLLNQAKDGTPYWVEIEIQPLRDDAGRLQGFMAIESDVTQRRQTQARLEAALRESDALLGTMDLHAIISTVDSTGTITDVNDAFCDISHYTREELIGQNHRIVNSGTHSQAFWQDMWKTISTGMPWRGDICNRAKNGDVYWVDTFIAPFIGNDGQIEKYISMRTDITHSKRAQEEALRSSNLLRGSIEAIDEAFVLFDPEDRLVLCNEKYRETYHEVAHLMAPGVRFEEIIRAGAHLGLYLGAVGRVDDWVAERLAAHLSGNTSLVQRLADGRSLRIIERKLADGHIVGFRIDITELMQATEAAEAASQSKSQFLANMSHEIRTPMNAILGMLTLLRKTPLTPKQADYAAKSEGAARSLLGLINEILDFSKIEAGKMTLDPQVFELDQMLRDLSVLLSSSAGSKAVEVLFDIDPQTPTQLLGDSMRLQQILLNLGSNAIKFTAEGEVMLSIHVMQRTADAVTLHFSMRDTGIGIAPENQARIFTGFTQAESSTTRRFGGTGLGVAISQRFVRMMGGELELQSTLGQGSRFFFTITLPLPLEVEPAKTVDLGTLRALAIDDNPMSREVLRQMAQSLGWTVDVAASGEQALQLLENRVHVGAPYQVVFVDWQMPGMDGWQTSQRIRELSNMGAVPVIVMVTAHGREMLAQRTEAEHALLDGFLVKPVTAAMLRDAVRDAHAGNNNAAVPRTIVPEGVARLDQMRLLVVEDNPNNQQVACELLQGEGAIVQIASDGQEGVDAVASANPPFDVVLMDLQMPIMDGFTATRHIRGVLGMATLPIVAMTANAMASDREACLAAGMNDHVGKPFDLNALVRVLRKQARWAETATEPGEIHMVLAQSVTETAERAGINLAAALQRLGGNQDIYLRMLTTFAKDLAALPAQLQGFAVNHQSIDAQRALHTLKGLAATLGATELAAEVALCEKRLSAPALPDALAQAVQQACHAIATHSEGLHALRDALQAVKAGQASPTDAPGAVNTALDTEALTHALQAMAQLLRAGDMDAMQAMGDLQLTFGNALGDALAPLEEAMAELDFTLALSHCLPLIESYRT
jgi:PAS domain S-box-containing protein